MDSCGIWNFKVFNFGGTYPVVKRKKKLLEVTEQVMEMVFTDL